MDFRYDFSNGRADMIYDSTEGESLDLLTWNMMKNLPESFCLLKTKMEKKDYGYSFRYDISGAINMMAWMEMADSMEKEAMLRRIRYAVDELKQWYIPKEELILEQQYLYVDDRTGEVLFICIPLKKEEVKERKIQEPYIVETRKDISINAACTEKGCGAPLPEIPPVPESPGFFEERNFWEKKKEEPMLTEEDIFSSISDTGIPVGLVAPEEKTVLLDPGDEEGTVLLNTHQMLRATLVRLKTQEKFFIEKSPCRIGKKISDVEICVQNNPALSRIHCIIRYLSGFYYLEDCRSSNFTYVDGKQVIPGESVKLTDSCRIQMADEEFIFYENK